MSGPASMGGRIVVVDQRPQSPAVEVLRGIGAACTHLPVVVAAELQALSAVDVVLIVASHPEAARIPALFRGARIDAPILWLDQGGDDGFADPPSPEELRTLSWIVRAEQRRRQNRVAEIEVSDANYLSELGRVVTQVAHEIRNPLTALSAKLQWLKRKSEGNDLVVDSANAMVEEVHRLSRMLNDMLEFGRSRTYSKRTSSDVSQTLNEVAVLYRETCENARVTLVLDHGQTVSRVPFPSEELHQIFQNLLTNAIDATPPDETITILVATADDGRLRVEFRNPGHLPEHIQEKAFELFFTTKPNGTGLGLPIVKRIVAGVSGEVEALNIGEEVVIRLTLPRIS